MNNARELAFRLLDLLRREQCAMADFLVALADFDSKRAWQELGHASLFAFLHRELGLSAGAAFYRKTAAELIQRLPEVVEPLRDGRLCLTSICELAKVITPENRAEVLPRFFHASKQEAKAVASEIAPCEAPPHRAVVTALAPVVAARQRASAPLALGQAFHPDETPAPCANVAAAGLTPPAPAPPPRTLAEPLTGDLRRLHVTVSKRFLAKLDAARDALSHSHRGADEEAILEAGLDLLIERHAKRRGIGANPRHPTFAREREGASDSRSIPAAVKREVCPRRRTVPMADRRRRRVRLDAATGVRPRRASRAGRGLHGWQPSPLLPRSQPAGGAARVRRQVDGPVCAAAVSGARRAPGAGRRARAARQSTRGRSHLRRACSPHLDRVAS